LLREQNLLRDVAKKHSALITAAGESRFQLQAERDMRWVSHCSFAKPGICCSTVSDFQCRVWCAFAADVRVDLHSPHLIQGR